MRASLIERTKALGSVLLFGMLLSMQPATAWSATAIINPGQDNTVKAAGSIEKLQNFGPIERKARLWITGRIGVTRYTHLGKTHDIDVLGLRGLNVVLSDTKIGGNICFFAPHLYQRDSQYHTYSDETNSR